MVEVKHFLVFLRSVLFPSGFFVLHGHLDMKGIRKDTTFTILLYLEKMESTLNSLSVINVFSLPFVVCTSCHNPSTGPEGVNRLVDGLYGNRGEGKGVVLTSPKPKYVRTTVPDLHNTIRLSSGNIRIRYLAVIIRDGVSQQLFYCFLYLHFTNQS